jgi:hypothetical protein
MFKEAVATRPLTQIDYAKIVAVSATLIASWAVVFGLDRLLFALIG